MANNVAFIEVHLSLRVQSSIVYGIIIAFTQKERLFLLSVLVVFAVVIVDLLDGTYPVHNWDLLIFDLVNYYVTDFDGRPFYQHQDVSSVHTRFHRSRKHDDHRRFRAKHEHNASPHYEGG